MRTLTVIVVGAGIAGLSTALALAADGHEVIVLDTIKEFTEVGAGIRVPPNSCKLLTEWGVDLGLIKKEVSRGNRFVSWKDKVLCEIPFSDDEFGAPYHFIHRTDLVEAMRKAAEKYAKNITQNTPLGLGTISIFTNSRVIEYDFDGPGVRTSGGEWYTGDLVVAADGIRSLARDEIIRAHHHPPNPLVDTGDVAYRILVPASPLLQDPDLTIRKLVTEPWATHWMGPEGHAVGYPLRGGELYNIIIDVTHRTDRGKSVGEAEWSKRADNRELVERFKDGWCPIVRRLCGMTGEYVKWKLAELERPLECWVHPGGKVTLLGDSAHPMMPYLAQGAAQVMEDAAALRAAIFSRLGLSGYSLELSESLEFSISSALSIYQSSRASRTAYITRNTQVLQEWLHLYDGPAQEERDRLMSLRNDERNPVFWASEVRRDWLFGWDARKIGQCQVGDGGKHVGGDIGGKGGKIPELPLFPPPESSVYPGRDLRGRLGIVS